MGWCDCAYSLKRHKAISVCSTMLVANEDVLEGTSEYDASREEKTAYVNSDAISPPGVLKPLGFKSRLFRDCLVIRRDATVWPGVHELGVTTGLHRTQGSILIESFRHYCRDSRREALGRLLSSGDDSV